MKKINGFTLLELLIVVVILGVLALIAAPTLLNASDRAKEGVVKANVSAAASTVTTRLTVEGENAADAAEEAIADLNVSDNPTDAGAAVSPFNPEISAFSDTAGEGVVTLNPAEGNDYTVTIVGYGKDDSIPLEHTAKTVSAALANDDEDVAAAGDDAVASGGDSTGGDAPAAVINRDDEEAD